MAEFENLDNARLLSLGLSRQESACSEWSQQSPRYGSEGHNRSDSVLPERTCGKHVLAIGVWLASLPVILLVTSFKLALTVLSLLLLTALTLRISSGQLASQDDRQNESGSDPTMQHDLLHESHLTDGIPVLVSAKPLAQSEQREERRLLLAVFIIASSIGSAIALSTGGASVARGWLFGEPKHCSVADLADLQEHVTPFFCSDGHVDMDNELSIIKTEGLLQSSYSMYRMAPVYLDARSKGKVPLALAVSKNDHLQDEPCDGGLCGFTMALQDDTCAGLICTTGSDQAAYAELQQSMSKALGASMEDRPIPIIQLMSPSDPDGKMRHFCLGMMLYLFTLGSLIGMQADICLSAKRGEPTDSSYVTLANSAPED